MIWYKYKTRDSIDELPRLAFHLFDSFEEAITWETLVNNDPCSGSATIIGPATQQELLDYVSKWSTPASERLMQLINDPKNYASNLSRK